VQQQLRVDTAAVQAMAARWEASVGELSTQVGARATAVATADACYAANETDSANELAAVTHPVTGE
jgi:hypothetical protein